VTADQADDLLAERGDQRQLAGLLERLQIRADGFLVDFVAEQADKLDQARRV
jgi:hypothetical protein